MLIRLSLFIPGATIIIFELYGNRGAESALIGAAGVSACGSMIFFSRFWSEHVLGFGFWESFASDAGNPSNSAPAVVFLGWILLALMGYAILSN